jgi:hypothetical protein
MGAARPARKSSTWVACLLGHLVDKFAAQAGKIHVKCKMMIYKGTNGTGNDFYSVFGWPSNAGTWHHRMRGLCFEYWVELPRLVGGGEKGEGMHECQDI